MLKTNSTDIFDTNKNIDELRIYRGLDHTISEHITIHQPTLGEICDYGEREYYSMIYQLCATPQTMKVQLWDMGIDYTTITPFELFYRILYRLYPQNKTSILFGDLDLTKFQVMKHKENDSVILYQTPEQIMMDESVYHAMTSYLRQIHNIQKDETMPANETTKRILIEDERAEAERSQNREYHSQLKNLISSMINSQGFKYNHAQIWDMKINAFLDSVKRISKIKNADLLLQSGYSGFGVNLKEISNDQINWLGELD